MKQGSLRGESGTIISFEMKRLGIPWWNNQPNRKKETMTTITQEDYELMVTK
jgi:hypothetical protein